MQANAKFYREHTEQNYERRREGKVKESRWNLLPYAMVAVGVYNRTVVMAKTETIALIVWAKLPVSMATGLTSAWSFGSAFVVAHPIVVILAGGALLCCSQRCRSIAKLTLFGGVVYTATAPAIAFAKIESAAAVVWSQLPLFMTTKAASVGGALKVFAVLHPYVAIAGALVVGGILLCRSARCRDAATLALFGGVVYGFAERATLASKALTQVESLGAMANSHIPVSVTSKLSSAWGMAATKTAPAWAAFKAFAVAHPIALPVGVAVVVGGTLFVLKRVSARKQAEQEGL